MDIYEYAMQMEKDGESFYREIALKAENKGIRNIFNMLADAEVVHYRTLREMKEGHKITLPDNAILRDVKNIFKDILDKKEFSNLDLSQVDLYKKAEEIEKRSRGFYLEKAGEVKEASDKDIFLKIADEENRHFHVLENIIDFVSRPLHWLENPEWYNQEE